MPRKAQLKFEHFFNSTTKARQAHQPALYHMMIKILCLTSQTEQFGVKVTAISSIETLVTSNFGQKTEKSHIKEQIFNQPERYANKLIIPLSEINYSKKSIPPYYLYRSRQYVLFNQSQLTFIFSSNQQLARLYI